MNSYYPFGLQFNSYSRVTSKQNDYLYNGKELQDELDLNWLDYGARIYDPAIGRWHVVDPMADIDHSIGFSPYHYAANNPLLYNDLDGMDFIIYYKDNEGNNQQFRFNGSNSDEAPDNEYVQQFLTAYHYNVNNGGGEAMAAAACDSEVNIGIVNSNLTTTSNNGYVYWNPMVGSENESNTLSPATILEHEVDHQYDDIKNPDEHSARRAEKSSNWTNMEEKRVIQGTERKTAIANGEIGKNEVTRTTHKTSTTTGSVIVKGVTSTKVDNQKTAEYYERLAKQEGLYVGYRDLFLQKAQYYRNRKD